jgi:hypothetical protein
MTYSAVGLTGAMAAAVRRLLIFISIGNGGGRLYDF